MYIFLSFIVLNEGILFLYPILNRELQFFFFFRFYRNCFVSVARKTNLFVVIILNTLRNLSVSFSLSFFSAYQKRLTIRTTNSSLIVSSVFFFSSAPLLPPHIILLTKRLQPLQINSPKVSLSSLTLHRLFGKCPLSTTAYHCAMYLCKFPQG